jgi:hypothetical protein
MLFTMRFSGYPRSHGKWKVSTAETDEQQVPDHIVAAKALASRLSDASLNEYFLNGKPV